MPKQIAMICPTLADQGGHEYDYTAMIASAALAQGMDSLSILPARAAGQFQLPGRTEAVLPDYSYPKSVFPCLVKAAMRILCYFYVFFRYKKPETLWFIHSTSRYEAAVMAAAWMLFPRGKQKLVLFIRQEIEASKWILIGLLKLAARRGVLFVSDSSDLTERMSEQFRCPVALLPIPILLPKMLRRDNAAVLCGYFGAKRPSKGFQNLPALVDAMRAIEPSACFVIQAYQHRDDKPDAAIDGLTEHFRKAPDIRLIEQPLDGEAFGNEVAACSIVLLPYPAEIYRTATSGIFVMAVAAGAVVVVTEGTWMARQAKKFDFSRVVFLPDNPSPEQAGKVLRQALALLKNPPPLTEREILWRANQSAENVLNLLGIFGTTTGLQT
jgi:hypothetical protein